MSSLEELSRSASMLDNQIQAIGHKSDESLETLYQPNASNVTETDKASKALIWRQDKRIMPLCAVIYLLCYLDRSNIGNARTLNGNVKHDLLSVTGMTTYQYTIALMAFLVAYSIFEVPSNYFLKKTSPSTWIAFLMFAWGSLTIGLGGAQNFAGVTAVRFLLGIFEAGLFPGLIYYLTFWYKTSERGTRIAFFFASATLAGAFGGALAYAIGHMDTVGGHPAWRWLFILEGIPSVVAAFFVYFLMPDYPETAKWLSAEEKALAQERLRLEGSHSSSAGITWESAKETLTEWRLYAHYLMFFCVSPPFSSLSLFSPTITAGLGFKDLDAQLFTVPPYAAAYICMLFTSWLADKYNARGLVAGTSALVGAVGYMTSALLPPTSFHERFGCLIIAACGTFSCVAPLIGWLTGNLHSTGAAGLAIAINASVGAPGQIMGVWIYKADEKARGYPTGHWTNAAMLFLLAIGCLSLTMYYRQLNVKLLKMGGQQRLFVY
ncbi:MFS transporter [Zopfia rhizophila CBS 207.26]|uniref:MFS transporter n=1 Tax=Zopfia rhizophila CBS 207.26 TaxID=1314779 RepID=A0A6A6EC68_9PEZI|nr:MFS transporter [Zopfia rhizophila CBS 207.26]